MPTILLVVTVVCAGLALAFLAAAIAALRRRRALGFAGGLLLALLLLTLSALFATIGVATQGYRALTREELAAVVEIHPRSPGRFTAVVERPNGARDSFELAGEQIYIDAHILKWKQIANIFGLHTAYQLDRIGGRWMDVDDERDSLRTIYGLKTERPLDMFTLRRRYALLAPLLDAEYGSGTFVMADRLATLDVLVSTTGLLIRPRAAP